MSTPHWWENAIHDQNGRYLGQDEHGNWWVPFRRLHTDDGEPWWGRWFNRWNPFHWPYWFRSWRDGACAYIQAGELHG